MIGPPDICRTKLPARNSPVMYHAFGITHFNRMFDALEIKRGQPQFQKGPVIMERASTLT